MASTASAKGTDQSRLVFSVGDQRHQIDAGPVVEVIRVPHLTRVPHGPVGLAGLANLRGRPLPVLSIDRDFKPGQGERGRDGKIIVYDHGGLVGLLVDDVSMAASDEVSADIPLRDLRQLFDTAFKVENRVARFDAKSVSSSGAIQPAEKRTAVLTFRAAGQLYGVTLENIREVTALGGELDLLGRHDSAVLGAMTLRGGVLPIVSLPALFRIGQPQPPRPGAPIVVIEHGEAIVGLLVDKIEAVYRLPDTAIDNVPPVLQKGHGDAKIASIGRVEGGTVLISILSPEKLFGDVAVSEAVRKNAGAEPVSSVPGNQETFEQFLLFRLGTELYGLPIGAVDEVVRVPDVVTRLPGAPKFVIGVMNLRGRAVPLIDQRLRFDTTEQAAGTKARAIIVTIGALQAGFVVDSVSEVQAISAGALSGAPEFASDRSDVFDRVAQVGPDGQMVLLVNPHELLTRAERDIIAELSNDKLADGKT
jgi:purine-binding chemotaxis protein CheW